jgi:hypothetical protein
METFIARAKQHKPVSIYEVLRNDVAELKRLLADLGNISVLSKLVSPEHVLSLHTDMQKIISICGLSAAF